MRSADIHVGERYRVREWSRPIAKGHPLEAMDTHYRVLGGGIGFGGHWRYWNVMVIKKQGQRYLVEWHEPMALHRIPEVPMRWSTRTVSRLMKPSQIVDKYEGR